MVLLSVAAYAVLKSETGQKVVKVVTDPGQAALGDKETANLLILGIDYNYTRRGIRHTKEARSDTMLVARVDRWGNSLSLLSIPRDTRVFVEAAGQYDKINATFAFGGPYQARKTVEQFLNIPIHHHVLVKVDAAAKLVDTLGGVPVTVEKEMHYDDNWAHFHVHLKPGPQVLNGEQVVGYCRFRMDEEGDFGRIRRQQQFLTALVRELKKSSNLKRIPQLAKLAHDNLQTDLTFDQMAALGRLYQGFSLGRLRKGTIPVVDAWIGGIAYLEPIEYQTRELVSELFGPVSDPTLGEFETEVVNATHVPGGATEAAKLIHQAGFSIIRSRLGGPVLETESYAIVRNNHPRVKKQLQRFAGITSVKKEKPQPGLPAVTVVIGDDLVSGD